ncbi:leucine-rich repeat domain-containing protein [Bacillus toyonensis]|uniref:leucine-rich repeat domain-containing protein n=1 Tax=Bacillus toyonensis TaxID=155322 RepID=UPI00124E1153|nr:leucine-rich repeat domain-containing protein [Bacillus toyonensis]KAB2355833.1 leucine-rich repeat domain-containing protein [Bacillus toyonensis]
MEKKIGNVRVREDSDGIEVLVSNKYLSECIEYINQHRITQVAIIDWYYKSEDVNFLSECPTVEEISLDSNYLKDISGLYHIKNLKALSLTDSTVLDGKNEIDLRAFSNLERLFLTWSKKIKGLDHLKNLKGLWMWKYAPKERNLQELNNLEQLEELVLNQCKISSLTGIGKLKNLRKLELNYLRTLNDVGDLKGLNHSLQRLEIEACKNIENLYRIGDLKALEFFILWNCGDIPSIGFVKELHQLKHFAFGGTNILDGDLSPCIEIDYIHFTEKKHYSHKRKDFINN